MYLFGWNLCDRNLNRLSLSPIPIHDLNLLRNSLFYSLFYNHVLCVLYPLGKPIVNVKETNPDQIKW